MMRTNSSPARWQTLLAFGIIYFVWGSTFLAIRVGVREVPPFLLAGMRFFAAGIAIYVWMRLKGAASPSRRQWGGTSLLATVWRNFVSWGVARLARIPRIISYSVIAENANR